VCIELHLVFTKTEQCVSCMGGAPQLGKPNIIVYANVFVRFEVSLLIHLASSC